MPRERPSLPSKVDVLMLDLDFEFHQVLLS